MSQPPAGAQISEDGNYWWDANANAWQLIQHDAGGAADASQAATGAQASNAPHVTADHVADMMASAEQDAAEIA